MSTRKQSYIDSHGGPHDFIASGAGASADQRYSYIQAWGGAAAITYEQMVNTAWVSGSATMAQFEGIYSAPGLRAVEVTDGGTVIAYRKIQP